MSTTTEAQPEAPPRWVNVRLPDDLAELLHQLAYTERKSKTALVLDAIRATYQK